MSGCVGMCMFYWRTWSVLETTGSESTRINCCVDRLDFHRKLGGDCKSCLSLCRTVISLLTFWFSCCIILLYSIIVDRFRIAWRRMRVALSASYPDRIFIEPHTTPRTAKPWRSKWWQSFSTFGGFARKFFAFYAWQFQEFGPVNPCLHHLEVQLVDSSTLNVWHVRSCSSRPPLISGVTQSHRIRRISESFLQNVAECCRSDMIWHRSAWKIF